MTAVTILQKYRIEGDAMPASDTQLMRDGWVKFTGLAARHPAITALMRVSQIRRLERGALLVTEGQPDASVYLLLSGSLRTLRYLSNGQEVWLTDAAPGELIGEMAALTGEARTSSVIARSAAILVAVDQAAFISVGSEHGAVTLAVSRLLARRLANTSRQMTDIIALTVVGRLRRELLRLGRPSDRKGELVRIDKPPSVSALAQRIHTNRETASRALSEIEERGWMLREGDTWIIPMPMEDPPPTGKRSRSRH